MVYVRIKSVVEMSVDEIEIVIRAVSPGSPVVTGDHEKDMELLGIHNKEVDAWERLHIGTAELVQEERGDE